jgi:subtilisin-like proprotein convertase family protein
MTKSKSAFCALILGASLPVHASITTYNWSSGFANSGIVPDNNLNGWQDTRVISDFQSGFQILDLDVTLNISGGFNGDLYGTLVHDSGFVVLLNHVGSTLGNPLGYSNPGMNVVFDQSAGTDVHFYGSFAGVVSGTYQPDGTVSPGTSLNSFNALDPNGNWTLFLSDTSFGDQSQVLNWGLQITGVPEPATMALGVTGIMGVGALAIQAVRRRGKIQAPAEVQFLTNEGGDPFQN